MCSRALCTFSYLGVSGLVGNGGHVVFVSLGSGCDGNLGEKSMSANALK